MTIVCRVNPNVAHKLVSSTLMHLFRQAFIKKISIENELVLVALLRLEAIEQAERDAVEREAAQAEPQMQLYRQVEDPHSPPEHFLQLDGVNNVDGLSPREPQQGDRYLAPTPRMTRTTTTTTTNSALPTQDLGKISPTKGGGFRVKWTNAPPGKETLLIVGRNIRIQFRGGKRQIMTSLPLARI